MQKKIKLKQDHLIEESMNRRHIVNEEAKVDMEENLSI